MVHLWRSMKERRNGTALVSTRSDSSVSGRTGCSACAAAPRKNSSSSSSTKKALTRRMRSPSREAEDLPQRTMQRGRDMNKLWRRLQKSHQEQEKGANEGTTTAPKLSEVVGILLVPESIQEVAPSPAAASVAAAATSTTVSDPVPLRRRRAESRDRRSAVQFNMTANQTFYYCAALDHPEACAKCELYYSAADVHNFGRAVQETVLGAMSMSQVRELYNNSDNRNNREEQFQRYRQVVDEFFCTCRSNPAKKNNREGVTLTEMVADDDEKKNRDENGHCCCVLAKHLREEEEDEEKAQQQQFLVEMLGLHRWIMGQEWDQETKGHREEMIKLIHLVHDCLDDLVQDDDTDGAALDHDAAHRHIAQQCRLVTAPYSIWAHESAKLYASLL